MIDDIYKTVQAELNKDQLGYLKPMYFNSFIRLAQRTVYNDIFTDFKSNVRKKNWHLDGKNLAHYSELLQQLLEYYSDETTLNFPFELPENTEFIADVFYKGKRVTKVSYSALQDIQGSLYATPSDCAPSCSKIGNKIKVLPNTITTVDLHFIRKPKVPKWTFQDILGKPMFDDTVLDFQDVDMPTTFFDKLVSIVVEKAAIMLRDQLPIQAEAADQQQIIQSENTQ